MAQSKTDTSKLKKYLTQQKQNALNGPPQTHTSAMLRSLLTGSGACIKHPNDKNDGVKQSGTGNNRNPDCRISIGGIGGVYASSNRQRMLKRKIDASTRTLISCMSHDNHVSEKRGRLCRENQTPKARYGNERVKSSITKFHAGPSKCNTDIGTESDMWTNVKLIGSQDKSSSPSLKSTTVAGAGLFGSLGDISNSCGETEKKRSPPLKSIVKNNQDQASFEIQRRNLTPLTQEKATYSTRNKPITSKSSKNTEVKSSIFKSHLLSKKRANSRLGRSHLRNRFLTNSTNQKIINMDVKESTLTSERFQPEEDEKGIIHSSVHKHTMQLSKRSPNQLVQDKKSLQQNCMVDDSSKYTTESDCTSFTNGKRIFETVKSLGSNVGTSIVLSSIPPFENTGSCHKSKSKYSPSILQTSTKLHQLAPPPKKKTCKKATSNENFVKLNLKNKAGSCRGARNLRQRYPQRKLNTKRNEFQDEYSHHYDLKISKDGSGTQKSELNGRKIHSIHDAIDPIDDYLDGTFHENPGKATKERDKGNFPVIAAKRANSSKHPLCTRHNRPCQLLVVKKNVNGNKARKFFVCSMPKGEQCNFFQWEDDTVEATKKELLESSSYSGFVARQVAAYNERLSTLTVPELRTFAKSRQINSNGQKKALLARLSVWVRDQICKDASNERDQSARTSLEIDDTKDQCCINLNEPIDENDADDDSTSSDVLEICTLVDIGESAHFKGNDSSNHGDSNCYKHRKNGLQKALFDFFGHSDFRYGQEWAIRRCIEKKRSLLVAPTGIGKSLCYALPAALMDGICIVVSPLIALIEVSQQSID